MQVLSELEGLNMYLAFEDRPYLHKGILRTGEHVVHTLLIILQHVRQKLATFYLRVRILFALATNMRHIVAFVLCCKPNEHLIKANIANPKSAFIFCICLQYHHHVCLCLQIKCFLNNHANLDAGSKTLKEAVSTFAKELSAFAMGQLFAHFSDRH